MMCSYLTSCGVGGTFRTKAQTSSRHNLKPLLIPFEMRVHRHGRRPSVTYSTHEKTTICHEDKQMHWFCKML